MQSQALWSGWIRWAWGPGGFPVPVHQSQMQDDSPVSAQFPFAGLARDHAGHVFRTGRCTRTHTHAHTRTLETVVETGFITQKIGLGFKKKAGERAVIRHRAWQAGVLPSSLLTCTHPLLPLFSPISLAYSSPIHLDPSVSPPWSACLFPDKQPNYLTTFSSWAPVLLHPHPNVKPLMLPLRSSQPYTVLSTRLPWCFWPCKLFFPKGLHQNLAFSHVPRHEPPVKRRQTSWHYS